MSELAPAVSYLLAMYFAVMWGAERKKRKEQTDKLPSNVKQIYWNK